MNVLSKAQERVVEALGHGAELIWGEGNQWIIRWNDGEIEKVNPVTARWLFDHKYIRQVSTTYELDDYCPTDSIIGKS